MGSLGVDVSDAGTTPGSARRFVGGLSADQQAHTQRSYESINSNPGNTGANIVAFCKNAYGQ